MIFLVRLPLFRQLLVLLPLLLHSLSFSRLALSALISALVRKNIWEIPLLSLPRNHFFCRVSLQEAFSIHFPERTAGHYQLFIF